MGEHSTAISDSQFEAVRRIAREHSKDRYLAALLAPRAVRGELIALAAFAGEIERIGLLVSEPALGEIRLRWWLDWTESLGGEAQSGNPVADVFGEVAVRCGLSHELITGVLDARGQELYGAPFETEHDYEGFLIRTEGALFELAAAIAAAPRGDVPGETGKGSAAGREDVLASFAKSYGGVRQLLRLPLLVRRGRWGLPAGNKNFDVAGLGEASMRARADELRFSAIDRVKQSLQAARGLSGGMQAETMLACLPAALVAPYLRALEEQCDWLLAEAEISPLSRVWHLWRSHLSGRV